MHKIKILDVWQEKKLFDNNSMKNKKKKEIIIKTNDSLFEIGLRKGLIEINDDGYYFIGDYGELLSFKNHESISVFKLLE